MYIYSIFWKVFYIFHRLLLNIFDAIIVVYRDSKHQLKQLYITTFYHKQNTNEVHELRKKDCTVTCHEIGN